MDGSLTIWKSQSELHSSRKSRDKEEAEWRVKKWVEVLPEGYLIGGGVARSSGVWQSGPARSSGS